MCRVLILLLYIKDTQKDVTRKNSLYHVTFPANFKILLGSLTSQNPFHCTFLVCAGTST